MREKSYLCQNFENMRKIFLALMLIWLPMLLHAQSMKGYYYNEEYQIYLYLSADSSDIKVPGQDIYGELPGYFGSKRDSRLWLITGCERKNKHQVKIEVINDYGSEDFEALLSEDRDGHITMKHLDGSTYKIVVNSKYVKVPKTIVLAKKEHP